MLDIYPGELGEGDPGGNYFTHGNIVIDFPQDVVVKISGQMESVCDPLS